MKISFQGIDLADISNLQFEFKHPMIGTDTYGDELIPVVILVAQNPERERRYEGSQVKALVAALRAYGATR